ncbi:hypothetical protein GCM10023209_14190 [Roseibacterium beibuensis]|uniref:Uncharacterized protein n=1 Tax=[Roseibacterium] beibuensis TaxID=1193142 RepID=A0ABP9L4N6_9RHOB
MGIGRDLALHGAQAESLARVIARVAHATIVENQNLGPAAFEKQLAIIRAVGRGAQNRKCGIFVDLGLKRSKRRGNLRHSGLRAGVKNDLCQVLAR